MDMQKDHGKFPGSPAAIVERLTVNFLQKHRGKGAFNASKEHSLGNHTGFFDSNFPKLAVKLQNICHLS